MFRKMRRYKQLLSEEIAADILARNTSGTLALLGDDDYPYAVPLSYVWAEGKIYFHSAREGHKIDAACHHEKASFCVIDQDQIVPEKYTTFFRSVIVFGKLRLIEEPSEMRRVATLLAMKYSSAFESGISKEIDSVIDHIAILELAVEHMTAKEAIELVKARP